MMKIKVLATAQSPDYYTFAGEVVTAYLDGESKEYDLSAVAAGDQVTVEELGGIKPIRSVERNADGELEVRLVQAVGPGHWSESDWMEPGDYDPAGANVVFDVEKDFTGVPTVKTRDGVQAVVLR